MRYIKCKISLIIILIFLAIASIFISAADLIYQYSSEQIITSGAILKNIKKFTTEGWQDINI